MATNFDRRLEKLEEAVNDIADPDTVAMTEEFYRLLDKVWGHDPQPGPRPRIPAPSREYLELLEKIWGHGNNEMKSDQEKAE
jgi:hypothetical protein